MTDLQIPMDDPYESLPSNLSVGVHMMAGAAAGIGEHCVMYPIDCVKTRMQSLFPDPKANYRNIIHAFTTIVRTEGIGRTVKGISAVVGGAGPAHAMYFACYEKLKVVFSGGKQGNHLANGAAGCVATVFHDIIMNPAEVIKQRMQLYNNTHATCTTCGRSILKAEGFRAFYRSYTTQLTMNVPFQSIHFIIYEMTQDWFNHDRVYNPKTHVVSGALAGAVSAIATMPLDVCKTVLNTQEPCTKLNLNYINGIRNTFSVVYRQKGIRGFYRGTQARVVFQVPATAISWSVYEFFKFILFKHRLFGDSNVSPTATCSSSPTDRS